MGLVAHRAKGCESSDQSWAIGNKSAYVTDSGLWTACRGSRARMLWHFKPVVGSQKTSLNMPFRRGDGEPHMLYRYIPVRPMEYLTIRPLEDLLYFDFSVGSGFSLPDIAYWRPLKESLRFRRQRPGGGWHPPSHVRHIAVEYDTDWREPHPDFALSTEAALQSGYIAGLEMCWLVDYNLRRRYQVDDESDRRGRRTFRAGDDHEFVEVLEADEEWWDPSSDRRYVDRQGRSMAYEFIRETERYCSGPVMEEIIVAWEAEDAARDAQQSNVVKSYGNKSEEDHSISWEATAEDGATATQDENAERQWPRLGVLAYVKRGSERDLPTRNQWLHTVAAIPGLSQRLFPIIDGYIFGNGSSSGNGQSLVSDWLKLICLQQL